jgi:hypothetical protein
MSRTRLAALALTAGALAGSGCGEAAKSSNGSGPLTRAELIAKADTICLGINAKRAATKFTASLAESARLLPALVAYDRAAVTELRKLIPPPSMANGLKEITAYVQTLANVTATANESAKANTRKLEKTQSLALEVVKARQRMVDAAKREGYKDCAQP